ncbi:MAG TPA: hypothetical protein VGM64_13990 [Lacunisphaera sp.]|jgi:hypothetical protein
MILSERLEIIRSRLKSINGPILSANKPAGQFRTSHPELPPLKRKKPYVRGPESPRYSFSVYGEVDGKSTNRKGWVETADKKPEINCAIKRKARVSPLTRISEQLPMKLPKATRTIN